MSNLPVFASKHILTSSLVDLGNVYLLPSVCFVGMLASLVNISVTCTNKSNDKIIKYILVNSTVDFLFLLIEFFLVIIRCGALCPYGYTYAAKFYEIYIYLYVGYVLVTFQTMLNIYILLERIRSFSNQRNVSCIRCKFNICCLIFLLVSVVLNAPPYLMSKQVQEYGLLARTNGTDGYEILYVKGTRVEFETKIIKLFLMFNILVDKPAMYFTICLLNGIIAVKFRQHIKRKQNLLSAVTVMAVVEPPIINQVRRRKSRRLTTSITLMVQKKEFNFTLVTLLCCMLYIVGNFFDTLALIFDVFTIDVYLRYGVVSIVANFFFFMSHSLNFFIYLKCYATFRKKLLTNWDKIAAALFRFIKR